MVLATARPTRTSSVAKGGSAGIRVRVDGAEPAWVSGSAEMASHEMVKQLNRMVKKEEREVRDLLSFFCWLARGIWVTNLTGLRVRVGQAIWKRVKQ